MDFQERLKLRERYSHVRENEHGMLLLDYMAENFHRFDRGEWQKKISEKCVCVNDETAFCDTVLKKHDRVSLFEELSEEPEVNLCWQTVYADDDLIIFDKCANLCVHPTGKFYKNTLWYQAGAKYGEIFFAGRLDRETSGLVIGCRSKKIAAVMQAKDFQIYKEYHALVHGRFEKYVRAAGFLSKDFSSSIAKKRRFTFEAAENSESCDTELFPVEVYDNGLSLVRAVLHSGRMHQIRATLFSLGFPLVGDKLYGVDETLYNKIADQSFSDADRKKLIFENQALHCSKLEFTHPVTAERLSFSSPPQFDER